MNTQTLLTYLQNSGVKLSLGEDDTLTIEAPAEAITDSLRATLREHKQELLQMLGDKELLDFAVSLGGEVIGQIDPHARQALVY